MPTSRYVVQCLPGTGGREVRPDVVPTLVGKRMTVSGAPGLGVELDRDRLSALHRRWLEDDGTHRERDDAAAMRAADPRWTTPAVPRW